MLINAGIREIRYQEGYADTMAEDMIKAAGLALTKTHGVKK
jgi:deoxycytidylate deaminase